MIIGFDNKTVHVIEEVVFDFSFDSGIAAHEHDSLISTWIVDELLPAIETALNEYDEKEKILRIEQITIDLGDIPGINYTNQINQRVYEQLVLQLKAARSFGKLISPTSRHPTQSTNLQHINSSTDGLVVQQASRLQSDLEILEHFLMTGDLLWYVDTTDSLAHEKFLERVLLDAKGGEALRTLMVKIPSTSRAVFVRRLVNQFSNKNLEKILIHSAPKQHELFLELVRAYQSVLFALQRPAMQQTRAMQLLWEQIFKTIIDKAHALDTMNSLNLSKVIPQMLQKLAAAALLDQNILVNQLIHASGQIKSTRLQEILTAQIQAPDHEQGFQEHSNETKTAGKQELTNGSYPLSTEFFPETSHYLPHEALLCRHIKAVLQQTEIDEAALFLEDLRSSNIGSIQKQLFEVLQNKRIRTLLISRLSKFILTDIIYLLSPQAAIITEQLLVHTGKLHRQIANRNQITIAEWEQQLWENALSFLVSTRLNSSFEATRFVQALTRMPPDNKDDVTVLRIWRDVLMKVQRQENSALQNILLGAISSSVSNQQDILINPHKQLITPAFAADQSTITRADIYQRIASALHKAGIIKPNLHLEIVRSGATQVFPARLLHILQKKERHTQLITKLPKSVLIDIAYVLSPQAALVLEQVLVYAEKFSRRENKHDHSDSKVWESQLLENALNYLANQPGEVLTTHSFNAFNFLHEILKELFDDEENRLALQSWRNDLQQQRHTKEIGTHVLQNIFLDAISIVVSEVHGILTSQEIKQITAALETDFTVQRQRLKTAIETRKLIPEKLSEDVSKPMIHALLKHHPDLTSVDRQTFVEAIELHARKTENRAFYYQQILAKLMSDETVDLEDISLQAEHHNLSDADTVLTTKKATAGNNQLIQEKESGAAVYQRILLVLKQVTENSPDMQFKHVQTANTALIKKQLLKLLQDKTWRTRLITQLPQSVLLDISYVLSPLAAMILEQLMLHDKILYRQTINKSQATIAEWKHQLWENALNFFVSLVQDHSFVGANFFHSLVYGLSDNIDQAVVLERWYEALKNEQEHEKTALTVLRNLLQESISSSKNAPHDILTGDEVRQILAALETDFEREQQRLKTAFYAGLFFPKELSEIELKHLVQALLKHDPALTAADRETFLETIAGHSRKAVHKVLYYQQIVEQLLLEQMVDLETILSRSMDLHDPAHAETDIEQSAIDSKAIIWQRIRIALKQSGITGVEQFLAQTYTANAQITHKHVLGLLPNTAVRIQLIAQLPESILVDIIYLLSPQAALMIEQVLFNTEMLFQYTPQKNAANVAEWKQQLWEGGFGYFLDMPTLDGSADHFDAIAFIHASIERLSDNNNGFRLIQSWHNALLLMQGVEYGQDHGTRVFRHVVETLMRQLDPGSQQKIEQLFHPHPQALETGIDDHAESIMTNQIVETDDDTKAGDEFYIHNAGQVLAAPYLPRLFNLLGLIAEGAFIDRSAAERAVHLLQFMVNEETQSPEYQLLLNKILCGLSTAIPICNRIEVSLPEQETVENLMQGMIQNWKIIGNTSIRGLRETFLQRNGRLLLKDEMWFLTIEPGPFDMLLDQLPWSFSVIKHSWMERAIHVTWR